MSSFLRSCAAASSSTFFVLETSAPPASRVASAALCASQFLEKNRHLESLLVVPVLVHIDALLSSPARENDCVILVRRLTLADEDVAGELDLELAAWLPFVWIPAVKHGKAACPFGQHARHVQFGVPFHEEFDI